MANTYTSLFYHLVFSTKNREPWLVPSIERRIWNYLGGVARAHKITPLQIGGVEDHIHALVMAKPTIAVFEIAKFLKAIPQNGSIKSLQTWQLLAGRTVMEASR